MSSAPDASNPADVQQGLGTMTVRGAVFLGVGSMVGAGIFALLGEAGAVAGAAVSRASERKQGREPRC